jgi:hypothetical protein
VLLIEDDFYPARAISLLALIGQTDEPRKMRAVKHALRRDAEKGGQ